MENISSISFNQSIYHIYNSLNLKEVEKLKKPGYSIWKPFMLAFNHVFKRTFTIKFPFFMLEPKERTVGRHLLDANACISCGLCVNICPSKAIRLVGKGKFGGLPEIDYGKCVFCELCVWICPENAIKNTSFYELSSYEKESLIYSPEMLSKIPKIKEKRIPVDLKFYKRLGLAHSRKG